jgi:release factor glutamine methyltransferase
MFLSLLFKNKRNVRIVVNFLTSIDVYPTMKKAYSPAEDSYLLAKYVQSYVGNHVLDMGTGSGIQAVTAAKKSSVKHVVAVDINPIALEKAKKRAIEEGVNDKIEFIESDLFDKVEGKFDWIIFNAPYLSSEGFDDLSWEGGIQGNEIILRFLEDAPNFLSKGGSILLVYSSLTNLPDFNSSLKFEVLEEVPLFFETLYCVKIQVLKSN